jgi:hypothetical protein
MFQAVNSTDEAAIWMMTKKTLSHHVNEYQQTIEFLKVRLQK